MRRLGSFLPGEVVGGAGVHWNGVTPGAGPTWNSRCARIYEERYGKNYIPADMTIQDWGITYAELEPYYDKFEYSPACRARPAISRRDPVRRQSVRGPRAREYPLPPLNQPRGRDVCRRPRDAAIIRFRGRPPTLRAPIPIPTAPSSARVSTAASASASAARRTPKAARTSR